MKLIIIEIAIKVVKMNWKFLNVNLIINHKEEVKPMVCNSNTDINSVLIEDN